MIRPKKCVIKVSSMVRLAGWWVLLAFVAFALPLVLTNPAAAGSILTAPVGGEKLTAGGTYVIKWNYQGPVGLNNWIDLDYSPDSGVSWQPIKHTISLNETQYSWSVPNSPTTQGKIKISVWNQHMGGTFQDPQFNTVLGGSEVSGAFTVADMIMPILIPVSLKTPSNLTAKAVSASQIDLEWTDETDKETGYRIERKTGGGSYEVIATVAADTSAYSDSGLTKGTTYTYRVKAVGNGLLIKDSQYSDEVSAKTKVPIIISPSTPPAPTNLTAVAVSGTAVNLSWTDTAGNETGFKIERKTDGESYACVVFVSLSLSVVVLVLLFCIVVALASFEYSELTNPLHALIR